MQPCWRLGGRHSHRQRTQRRVTDDGGAQDLVHSDRPIDRQKSRLAGRYSSCPFGHLKDKVITITSDNELEFAGYEEIAKGLASDVYFAHPNAFWERGINENTNGLIHQYFPKGADFRKVTDDQVRFVMDGLNSRPSATRCGSSPNELFMG